MQKELRGLLAFIGAVVVPFIIFWVDLKLNEGRNDTVAFVLALVASGISIAFLPVSEKLRCFLGVIWIPILFAGLFIFGLTYVCNNYGNCL